VNLISPKVYRDLLLPLDQKLAAVYGNLGIHNCAIRLVKVGHGVIPFLAAATTCATLAVPRPFPLCHSVTFGTAARPTSNLNFCHFTQQTKRLLPKPT
jgi:hypothetical protein